MNTANHILMHQLCQLEWLIQTDLGCRGIHRLPKDNLCTRTQGNLAKAVQFLSEHPGCQVGIATGFFISNAQPPAPENDGPPGALLMARGLTLLGYPVVLISDMYSIRLLEMGLEIFAEQLTNCTIAEIPLQLQPPPHLVGATTANWQLDGMRSFVRGFFSRYPDLSCLIAIERVGPSHTLESFLSQQAFPDERDIDLFKSTGPGELQGQPLTMNGIPVGPYTAPIHALFEENYTASRAIFTVGIGDGGNEIGMGSIPWQVIVANIATEHAGKFACRVATDATIVAGVSNWAAWALMAGLFLCHKRVDEFLQLFDEAAETQLMQRYVLSGSAVDGRLGYPAMSVDGIPWELNIQIYRLIKAIVANYR